MKKAMKSLKILSCFFGVFSGYQANAKAPLFPSKAKAPLTVTASPSPFPPLPRRPINNANPHLVAWSNLFFPGAGELIRGNYGEGLTQTAYESATFMSGYLLSEKESFSSLDGISDSFKPFNRLSRGERNSQVSLERKMFSNILLEFSIKAHMTNTFLAYRDAYKAQGVTLGLDQHTEWEAFMSPFEKKYLLDSDVWIPLTIVAASVIADYATTQPAAVSALNPRSNFLYDFNYGIWQPIGSGYPEESFFRGFLQNEVKLATHSPVMAVLAQSIAFALSHEPGGGRYSAALVGMYLGYLAEKKHGDLGPGIAVHFWGDIFLGVETALLSHREQKTTPQAGFTLQFNY